MYFHQNAACAHGMQEQWGDQSCQHANTGASTAEIDQQKPRALWWVLAFFDDTEPTPIGLVHWSKSQWVVVVHKQQALQFARIITTT